MSSLFQTVGTLSHREGIAVDASAAVDIITSNPLVGFYDIRRGFEGNLVDMQNAYIEGSRYLMAQWVTDYQITDHWYRDYHALLERTTPREGFGGFVSGASFFYGTVLNVEYIDFWTHGHATPWYPPHVLIQVRVDGAVLGYPERLFDGQIFHLRWDFPDPENPHSSPFDDIVIGEKYFFSSTFYFMMGRLQMFRDNMMKMVEPLGDTGLYFLPAEEANLEEPGIARDMMFAEHTQSAVYLRTTRDMTAMADAQESLDLLTLRQGRFLDIDDYLNENPVVVINRRFAELRGVSVGDTIRVNINEDQHMVYSPYYLVTGQSDSNPSALRLTIFPDLGVLATPDSEVAVYLELEVVGIFDLVRRRQITTAWSSLNKYMFIPDSLVPDTLKIATFDDNYIPANWFSFTLHNQRDTDLFLLEVREELAELGFYINFMGRDGSSFWAVSDVISMSTTLNLVLFSIVLLFVLILVVALFLWQRTKEYAILRALGRTTQNVFMQSTVALIFFGLPATILGSYAGWVYALDLSQESMSGFTQIIIEHGGLHLLPSERAAMIERYTMAVLPHSGWLVAMIVLIFCLMVLFVVVGNIKASRTSVLETLQGARQ